MNAHLALEKLNYLVNEAPPRQREYQHHVLNQIKEFAEKKWKPIVREMSDSTLENMVKAGLCSRTRKEWLTKSGGLYSERITYTWKGPPLKLEAVQAWTSRPGPRAPKLRDQLELLRERDFLRAPKVKIGNKSVFFLGTTPDPDYPEEQQVWCVEWSTGKVLGAGESTNDAVFAAKSKGNLK